MASHSVFYGMVPIGPFKTEALIHLTVQSVHIRLLSFELCVCVCVCVCARICVNSHQPKRATLPSHLLPGGDPHLTPELPGRSAKVFCCDCSTVHLLLLINPSFFISYSQGSDDTPSLPNSPYAEPHLRVCLLENLT